MAKSGGETLAFRELTSRAGKIIKGAAEDTEQIWRSDCAEDSDFEANCTQVLLML